MNNPSTKNIYSIPAGIPFAKALAANLLDNVDDQPERLSQVRIFLPTRRSCRIVREAFLQISNGKALLLPRLQTLGDIGEEELSLSIAGKYGIDAFLNLPPGITPLRRQLLLSRTIEALPEFGQGPDHALALASSLGQLMDQIYTENLNLADLDQLVPSEFADHWQITIKFLEILSENWPKILEEKGVIDIADRRNRLTLALSNHWRKNPPPFPVIAAGSTGSIPATAHLLSTIADLPQGQVILPGLDQNMDKESWDSLEESHPQYGFKHLCAQIDIQPGHVKNWPVKTDNDIFIARQELAREIMRPADTTHTWATLGQKPENIEAFKTAFKELKRFDCEHEREEAETIALLMREILEEPKKTAALITPDRGLARRVTMACARWDIALDDSAGQKLNQTSLGAYLRLCTETCLQELAPASLLALLKHSLCLTTSDKKDVHQLETMILRGSKPAAGFQGLHDRLQTKENTEDLKILLEKIEPAFAPFITLTDGYHHFRDFLKAHINMAEELSSPERLWANEEGEAASNFLSELWEQAELPNSITAQHYVDMLEQLLKNITVRPAYGTHPRLMILGQLEARMIDADLVILGGLNEGTWPPDPGHDPWMSRPMRKNFGLPSPEKEVGLAAHDFVQGFCAPRVVLTRSKRNQGAPSVPARWLQRLDTVLTAANLSQDDLKSAPHMLWSQQLDQHEALTPYNRPAPSPPIEKRPRSLSASQIETWLKDPYAIYARYVLKLRKLDPLEQPPDAALRGTLLHSILERFVTAHPKDIPNDASDILKTYASDEINTRHDDSSVWSFWWPRFARLSDWYIAHEKTWRKSALPLKSEAKGQIDIQTNGDPFTITARADRIDKTDNGAAIIDYKSGGTYSKKAIETGDLPQLPVEALIVSKGGFKDIPKNVASLSYWTLTGGTLPGKITHIHDDIETIITRTEEGIKTLIESFDNPETPYYSLPRPDKAPRFNDYEHLARVQEWTALGDSDTEEA